MKKISLAHTENSNNIERRYILPKRETISITQNAAGILLLLLLTLLLLHTVIHGRVKMRLSYYGTEYYVATF